MKVNNFSIITNITSLEELSQYDQLFRSYTNSFVTDKSLVDDIVQEMYLKIYKLFITYPDKVINGGYVIITLKNIYLNQIKLINKTDKGSLTNQAIIPDVIDDTDDIIEHKENQEELYNIIEERVNNLHWYEKEILYQEENMSLYQLSKRSGISYRSLIYSRNKINIKLGIKKKK